MRDRLRGLRQALVLLVSSAVVGLVIGGLWSLLQGASFRSRAGIALMIVAGLLSLTGGVTFGRTASIGERAFLDMGPDVDEADTGPGLTGLGIFLFVSLPLFVAGGVLAGSG